MKIDPGT